MTYLAKTHVHHWHIEPANGRLCSPGVCLDCGVERKFNNSQVEPVSTNPVRYDVRLFGRV